MSEKLCHVLPPRRSVLFLNGLRALCQWGCKEAAQLESPLPTRGAGAPPSACTWFACSQRVLGEEATMLWRMVCTSTQKLFGVVCTHLATAVAGSTQLKPSAKARLAAFWFLLFGVMGPRWLVLVTYQEFGEGICCNRDHGRGSNEQDGRGG